MRKILADNAAELYDFDLDALAPLAARFGPRGRRDRPAADRAARPSQRGAATQRARRLIASSSPGPITVLDHPGRSALHGTLQPPDPACED